ncbi:hypothetical protein DRN73_05285 [Candidatus Pacearchaeota archaeon]|nr:MAG: hypothetical protein DRN73_05285 [Candidatus Pacearchaeota archaeon]
MKQVYLSSDGKLFETKEDCLKHEKELAKELEVYSNSGLWNLVTSRHKKWGFDGYEWMGINRASGHLGKSWSRGTIPETRAIFRCREFLWKCTWILNGNYSETEKELRELGVNLDLIKKYLNYLISKKLKLEYIAG